MRVLTYLLVILFIAAVLLYFLPGTIHIEKSMVVKARQEVVYNSLNSTQEWKNWAWFLKEDPASIINYNGPSDGPGAALNWSSLIPDLRTGNVLVQTSEPATQVKALIRYDKYGSSSNTFLTENTGNGTKVTWTADIDVTNGGSPTGWLNKIKAFSWKAQLDKAMDVSLKSLDETTANTVYIPGNNDPLSIKLDALYRKVDSLTQPKTRRDTVYVDTLSGKH